MKLLLVDDEEYVIESIKRNLDLTETGVSEVYTAFSVQQAKNIMGMVDIDIVISDIVMPGGTGFDFVEWVRKEELKVQVIFLTSYAEFDYARRAIQLNSVDYLLKPIDFDKLKEAVQRAAESVAKEKKIQDLRQESIKWNQNRKILQQDIWKNVLKDGFSESVAGALPGVGKEATLYTVMSVTENDVSLYGFATEEQQACFEMLTAVSGVGPKVGLAILSVMEPDRVAR